MADTAINLAINTTADTAALIEATTGISRMDAAESQLAAKRKQFLTSAEREVAEVNRLVEASQKMDAASRAAAASTELLTREQIETAEAAGRATKKFQEESLAKLKLGTSAVTGGRDMQKFGMLANQASYQLGDFTTQVTMGTSAVRAFGMQAPQMIGALQMAGVVSGGAAMALGGVAVVLPLIAMAIDKFSSSVDTLTPKLEALNKDVDKHAGLITKAYEAHAKDQEMAEARIQTWEELHEAQRSAGTSALDNAAKQLIAYEALNEALGIQLDTIQTVADIEQAKREKAAKDAAEAQMRSALGSAGAVADTQSKLNSINAEIERLSRESMVREAAANAMSARIDAARARGGGTEQLEVARGELRAEMQTILQAMRALTEQATALEQEVAVQTKNANDKMAAAEVAIQEIGDTLAADTAVATAGVVKDQMKRQADDLKTILADITPHNDAQRQAVEELRVIAADGKVTATETADVGRNLQTLLGGVRQGISEYKGTTQQLIALIQQMSRDNTDLRRSVDDIRTQLGVITRRIP